MATGTAYSPRWITRQFPSAMTNAEAWKKGIIEGYQSKKPGHIPPIPPYPTVPAGVRDREKYYYDLGYQEGIKKAK